MIKNVHDHTMTKYEHNHIVKLAPYLGGLVNTPQGIKQLEEIYSNGNVLCISAASGETPQLFIEISEYHALSVSGHKLPKHELEE